MIHGDEEPGPAVVLRARHGRVGAPHLLRPFGHEHAVVDAGPSAPPRPPLRQQCMLAHDAQDTPPGEADPGKAGPRVHLPMPLPTEAMDSLSRSRSLWRMSSASSSSLRCGFGPRVSSSLGWRCRYRVARLAPSQWHSFLVGTAPEIRRITSSTSGAPKGPAFPPGPAWRPPGPRPASRARRFSPKGAGARRRRQLRSRGPSCGS